MATRDHIVEQIEVRRMIEPEMGRLASERVARENVQHTEAALAAMEADLDTGGLGSDFDVAFDAAIASRTNNELVTHIVELIGNALREQREFLQTPESARRLLEDHRAILAAIVRRDGDAAYPRHPSAHRYCPRAAREGHPGLSA